MVWSITIIKSFFLLRKTAERQKNPVTSGKTKVEIYTNKLEMAGMHRHFILFGLMHHLERRSVPPWCLFDNLRARRCAKEKSSYLLIQQFG